MTHVHYTLPGFKITYWYFIMWFIFCRRCHWLSILRIFWTCCDIFIVTILIWHLKLIRKYNWLLTIRLIVKMFGDQQAVEVHKHSENEQKRMKPIPSHLDWTSLINRGFITWKNTIFLWERAGNPKRANSTICPVKVGVQVINVSVSGFKSIVMNAGFFVFPILGF